MKLKLKFIILFRVTYTKHCTVTSCLSIVMNHLFLILEKSTGSSGRACYYSVKELLLPCFTFQNTRYQSEREVSGK